MPNTKSTQLGVRVDAALALEVKVYALRNGLKFHKAVEEGLRLLLAKHNVKVPAASK